MGKEEERIHCNPSCRVSVYLEDEPYVALYEDTKLYDFSTADGLWYGPVEPIEQPESPKSKGLPQGC